MAKKRTAKKAEAPAPEAPKEPQIQEEKSIEVNLSNLNRKTVETLIDYLNGRVPEEKAVKTVQDLIK